jgi:outer membrane protein TolC
VKIRLAHRLPIRIRRAGGLPQEYAMRRTLLCAVAASLPVGCAALPDPAGSEDFRRVWARVARVSAPTPADRAAGDDPAGRPAGVPPIRDEWMPVDLPAALALAGADNLTVKTAEEVVNEQAGFETLALSRFLPSLLPRYAYNEHRGEAQKTEGAFLNAPRHSHTAVNRTTLAVNPGRAVFEALAARQTRRASEFGVERITLEVLLVAAQQYFDLVRSLHQVGIAEESLRQAEEILRVNRDRMQKGVGLQLDVARSEARAAEARQFVQEATAAYRLASIRLAVTLQIPPDVTLYPRDPAVTPIEFVPPTAALEGLYRSALANHPSLKEQAMLVLAAETARSGAILEPFLPRITAEANNGWLGPNLQTMNNFGDYTVGLQWEIEGLGLGNLGRERVARARLRQAELRAEDVRQRLLASVAESMQEVGLLRSLTETAARQAAAAEEGFRLAENRYKSGTGLFLDVLDAQAQLTRARVNRLVVVIEFNKAQFRLFTRIGERPNEERIRKAAAEAPAP